MPEPKVTLLTWTRHPLGTVYAVWEASKNEKPLVTPEEVLATVDPKKVRDLFRAVIAQNPESGAVGRRHRDVRR
jgi:hypothetical protein